MKCGKSMLGRYIPRCILFTILFFAIPVLMLGIDYCGQVVDAQGEPLPFATVYPIDTPVLGTVTNGAGFFQISDDVAASSNVIISFIGFERKTLPLSTFLKRENDSCVKIVLSEQPIELKETVVASNQRRLTKKQKVVSSLLYKVYVQMEKDFPSTPTLYHFVSDARMLSSGKGWGMEQLIGKAVVLPEKGKVLRGTTIRRDSIQYAPIFCKRYFPQSARRQADSILSQKELKDNVRKFALGIDSGIVVHKSFFGFGNAKTNMEHYMEDLKHWKIEEKDNQLVLTHTEKHNYIGILIYTYQLHYVVDSKTFHLLRFYQTGEMKVNIPFGKKLDVSQLKLLNLFNMSDSEIGKFRLRKFSANAIMNTYFTQIENKIVMHEKNVSANALISGSKKISIPLQVTGTLKVTDCQLNSTLLKKEEMREVIQRQIVEVF